MRGQPLDLVRRRGWFYLFSFLILLPGAISLLIPPRLVPGIDFSSGSTFTVRFEEAVYTERADGELPKSRLCELMELAQREAYGDALADD